LEEISELKIFPECFRGPLKTMWRAKCGPQAANCPPLEHYLQKLLFDDFCIVT